MAVGPFLAADPLQFRGVADSLAAYHLEGSECCLIHADNSLSSDLGVWVNPLVRVGYDGAAYEHAHTSGSWLTFWEVIWGIWLNRMLRCIEWIPLERWEILERLDIWRREGLVTGQSRAEPGAFCLVDEMQVLVANGWAQV